MVDQGPVGLLAQPPALGSGNHQPPPSGSHSIDNGRVVGAVASTAAAPSGSTG